LPTALRIYTAFSVSSNAYVMRIKSIATSLSRLWQQQGKKDEARQMLAEVYGWFTEGFDTKDLQEAKALLDEL
jgi:predicted ATPase